MPMATSFMPILNGPSAPMRASEDMSRNEPIAIPCPLHAAITGNGNDNKRSASLAPTRSISISGSIPCLKTARSKPAEKTPSLPVRMTTERCSSA